VILQAKPFYLRDIQIGSTTLPITPVTAIIMILSLFMLLRGATSGTKSTATASHILLDGDDAEKRLTDMKKEIKQDYNKFKNLAKMHSKCPSGKSAGGKLGKFKPGMMVPVSLWFACLGVIVCFVY
jgi:parvulin-like peptidyl-prolyl isomerase